MKYLSIIPGRIKMEAKGYDRVVSFLEKATGNRSRVKSKIT